MPETVLNLIDNAEALVKSIKKHSDGAHVLMTETQSIFCTLDALKQYEEEVVELNSHRNKQPHSALLVALHRENDQLRRLRHENNELRSSIAEHQSTIDMIMCKYREHVSKLTSQNIVDRRIKERLMEKADIAARNNTTQGSNANKGQPGFSTPTHYDNLALQNKICEMASVMKRAIQCDQTSAHETQRTIKNLMDQNENLRQLMGISKMNFEGNRDNYPKLECNSQDESDNETVSLEERMALKHSLAINSEGKVVFHCPVEDVCDNSNHPGSSNTVHISSSAASSSNSSSTNNNKYNSRSNHTAKSKRAPQKCFATTAPVGKLLRHTPVTTDEPMEDPPHPHDGSQPARQLQTSSCAAPVLISSYAAPAAPLYIDHVDSSSSPRDDVANSCSLEARGTPIDGVEIIGECRQAVGCWNMQDNNFDVDNDSDSQISDVDTILGDEDTSAYTAVNGFNGETDAHYDQEHHHHHHYDGNGDIDDVCYVPSPPRENSTPHCDSTVAPHTRQTLGESRADPSISPNTTDNPRTACQEQREGVNDEVENPTHPQEVEIIICPDTTSDTEVTSMGNGDLPQRQLAAQTTTTTTNTKEKRPRAVSQRPCRSQMKALAAKLQLEDESLNVNADTTSDPTDSTTDPTDTNSTPSSRVEQAVIQGSDGSPPLPTSEQSAQVVVTSAKPGVSVLDESKCGGDNASPPHCQETPAANDDANKTCDNSETENFSATEIIENHVSVNDNSRKLVTNDVTMNDNSVSENDTKSDALGDLSAALNDISIKETQSDSTAGNDFSGADNNVTLNENNVTSTLIESSTTEKEVPSKGKDELSIKKEESNKEKEELSIEKDESRKDRNEMNKEKVEFSKEKDESRKDRDEMNKERDELNKEKEESSLEKNVSSIEMNKSNKEKDENDRATIENGIH